MFPRPSLMAVSATHVSKVVCYLLNYIYVLLCDLLSHINTKNTYQVSTHNIYFKRYFFKLSVMGVSMGLEIIYLIIKEFLFSRFILYLVSAIVEI